MLILSVANACLSRNSIILLFASFFAAVSFGGGFGGASWLGWGVTFERSSIGRGTAVEIGKDAVKLADEFVASVAGKDFVEPADVWLGVFGGDNFDNVALLEFGVEADHFAVNDGTGAAGADFTVQAIGKI